MLHTILIAGGIAPLSDDAVAARAENDVSQSPVAPLRDIRRDGNYRWGGPGAAHPTRA